MLFWLAGATVAIAASFPLAALVALVFRFPIPFGSYMSGPDAVVPALFAAGSTCFSADLRCRRLWALLPEGSRREPRRPRIRVRGSDAWHLRRSRPSPAF
jgi:hypothetical protein